MESEKRSFLKEEEKFCFTNDGQEPNYKITWFDLSSSQIRECTIYSYEKEEGIAIAIFKLLYPGQNLFYVQELNSA